MRFRCRVLETWDGEVGTICTAHSFDIDPIRMLRVHRRTREEKKQTFRFYFFLSCCSSNWIHTGHPCRAKEPHSFIKYGNISLYIISIRCVLRIVGNETGYELRVSVAFISKSFRWHSARSEQFSRGPLAHTIVVIAEIILIISINYTISCRRRCGRFWKGRGSMPSSAIRAPPTEPVTSAAIIHF